MKEKKVKRIVILFGIFLIGDILFACTTKVVPVEKPPHIAATIAKEGWEQEWERILSEAKKEGRVALHVFSGITPHVRQELSRAFRSKYGIELEMIAGRAVELAEKLFRERRAGLYLADVYLDGSTGVFTLIKPQGVLDPLEPMLVLPEVTNKELWFEGRLPFMDKDKFVLGLLAYMTGEIDINTDIVKREELQSYPDLLHSRWKGRIIMGDPSIGGAAGLWFSTMGVRVLGIDYLKELAKQEIVLSRNLRQLGEWLARGKYPVLIGAGGATDQLEQAGAPISSIFLREGGYMSTGGTVLAVYKNSPHPNAAKVFINWMLGKEAGTIYSRGEDQQSARLDVPIEGLSPEKLRRPGLPYFDTRKEEFQVKQSEYQLLAKEIFNIK